MLMIEKILANEYTWLASALIILVYFSFKPIRNAILAALDARIKNINSEVEDALKLKKSVQNQLDEAREMHKQAEENNVAYRLEAEQKAAEIMQEAHAKIAEITEHSKAMIELHRIKNDNDLVNSLKSDIIVTVISMIEEQYEKDRQAAESQEEDGDLDDNDDNNSARISLLNKIWH